MTFDLSFGQETVENGQKLAKYPNLLDVDRFLAKKGVNCCPISILRPDLESSHPGTSLRPQI